MKRTLIALMLAAALCLSLCACGNMREDGAVSGGGTDRYDTDRTGTANNGANGTVNNGVNNGTATNGTDMAPDPKDGYVEDHTADDGVVGATPAPDTNVKKTR